MHLSLLLDMAADGYDGRLILGRRSSGLTARQLRARAGGAAGLAAARAADAIVYLAVNGPAFPTALFGAALAGVPLVPVNYRLGEEQLDAVLRNHPRAIGIADPGPSSAALARHGIPAWSPEAFLAEAVSANLVEPVASEAPAVIIYTSGTTSAPKGVLLRHENITSYVLGSVEFGSAGPDEAVLVSVPPYHIAAVANVLSNIYAGRRIVTLEQFQPAAWLETVRSELITNAMVVPTMLGRILDLAGADPVPSLRLLAYGGAPMPAKTLDRALRAWPDIDFVNAYGLTETSSTISVLGPDEHRQALTSPDPLVRARLGSVGRVLPSVEVQIRDVDGRPLSAGHSGRIWIKGPQVSGEYSGTGKMVDDDGFFDTRDEGRLDEAGYLFLAGRTDDTIIRGAENIAPAEIEDVLLEHPDVADAVVVGVPDEEWGQVIAAAVVLAPGAAQDADALKTHVRSRLRSSKTPVDIVFRTELPRTDTGKILRRVVLEDVLRRGVNTAAPA